MIYKNSDMDQLESCLKDAAGARIRMIATDGVFSMDGIVANLRDICGLADRYDALSPAALSFLGAIAEQCAAAGKPVMVCGDVASRPLEAMALVGLGFRGLSMPPAAIGPVKEMIRHVELGPLARYLRDLMRLPDHSVREKLRIYAQERGILA